MKPYLWNVSLNKMYLLSLHFCPVFRLHGDRSKPSTQVPSHSHPLQLSLPEWKKVQAQLRQKPKYSMIFHVWNILWRHKFKSNKDIWILKKSFWKLMVMYFMMCNSLEFFSRVHATLQPALSVGRSVGWSVGWSHFTFFINFISLSHF